MQFPFHPKQSHTSPTTLGCSSSDILWEARLTLAGAVWSTHILISLIGVQLKCRDTGSLVLTLLFLAHPPGLVHNLKTLLFAWRWTGLSPYLGAGVCHCHYSGTPRCILIPLRPTSPAAASLSPPADGSYSSEKYLREDTSDPWHKHSLCCKLGVQFYVCTKILSLGPIFRQEKDLDTNSIKLSVNLGLRTQNYSHFCCFKMSVSFCTTVQHKVEQSTMSSKVTWQAWNKPQGRTVVGSLFCSSHRWSKFNIQLAG